MLEFFRNYQRYFFFVITVVVIASFTFFGTYGTFDHTGEREDWAVSQTVDGSSMMFSEVQKLSRFIASNRDDVFHPRGAPPNLCNDGVIRKDFLDDGLAELIVAGYFDELKADFEGSLDKAKRFRSYVHPQADFLSAKNVWNHFLPELNNEIAALQAEKEVSPVVFTKLKNIYQMQGRLHPEMLRRILVHQHRQYPWLSVDERLSRDDLAIFGCHSATDWFGHNFIDLIAEFILNVADRAEMKGYYVSLEEAKGDLIHHFQESVANLSKQNARPDFGFHHHLRSLNFDQRTAAECWQKVLLFRKYLRDVGEAAFVDRMPYREFAEYASESAVVDRFTWPIQLQGAQDIAEMNAYIKAIARNMDGDLPVAILPAEEVQKSCPELVRTRYKASIAEVSRDELALRPTVKEVWQWQKDEKNYAALQREYSLENAGDADSRFQVINRLDPNLRAELDTFTRQKIVDAHSEWLEEALESAPYNEKEWIVLGNEDPIYKKEGVYTRIKDLEIIEDTHILPFNKAREALRKIIGEVKEETLKGKNPFKLASETALKSIQHNPEDPRWIGSGLNATLDQFKLQSKELAITRTSKEGWMKNQAFMMMPETWSPVHEAEDGKVIFFYLKERKTAPGPILDQISVGKETLARDAKAFFAEKFLHAVKDKNSIVIPLQKEDE